MCRKTTYIKTSYIKTDKLSHIKKNNAKTKFTVIQTKKFDSCKKTMLVFLLKRRVANVCFWEMSEQC